MLSSLFDRKVAASHGELCKVAKVLFRRWIYHTANVFRGNATEEPKIVLFI